MLREKSRKRGPGGCPLSGGIKPPSPEPAVLVPSNLGFFDVRAHEQSQLVRGAPLFELIPQAKKRACG